MLLFALRPKRYFRGMFCEYLNHQTDILADIYTSSFLSIRQKMDGNRKFDYEIANLVQLYENLNNKKDYSSLLREVLIHLSEEEIK